MERSSSRVNKRKAKARKRELVIVGIIAVVIVIALSVFALTLRKTVSTNEEKIARIESLKCSPQVDTLFRLLVPLGYTLSIKAVK